MRLRCALAALLAALLAAPPAGAEPADNALAPFRMVRSLQRLQEAIASGDQASLPLQRRLLAMTDRAFRDMNDTALGQASNRQALLIYAISGGNPATLELTLARLPADNEERKLGAALLPYLLGQPAAAKVALAKVDPMALPPELGAYLALVKGSVLAAEKPKDALALLDRARLLSPGTLVEEAALRRSIGLAVALKDAPRFLNAAHRYVTAFAQSPYASQFADGFVDGVIAFNAQVGIEAVAELAALMNAEQERVLWLRIARAAALDGLVDLAAAASDRAGAGDARAQLYASLWDVARETPEQTQAKLAAIDREALSPGDMRLLDAVSAVAAGVGQPVAGLPPKTVEPAPAVLASAEAPRDPVEENLAASRQKLADIDKLLEATPE